MSEAWNVYRSRHEVLSAMVEKVDRIGYHAKPWEVFPQVWDVFDDEGQILQELHHWWNTALSGAVALAVEEGIGELYDDVIAAYGKVVDSHRGLRKILEAHEEEPTLAPLMRRERAMLASVAGVLWSELHLPTADEIPVPAVVKRSRWLRALIGAPEPA